VQGSNSAWLAVGLWVTHEVRLVSLTDPDMPSILVTLSSTPRSLCSLSLGGRLFLFAGTAGGDVALFALSHATGGNAAGGMVVETCGRVAVGLGGVTLQCLYGQGGEPVGVLAHADQVLLIRRAEGHGQGGECPVLSVLLQCFSAVSIGLEYTFSLRGSSVAHVCCSISQLDAGQAIASKCFVIAMCQKRMWSVSFDRTCESVEFKNGCVPLF
jgi:hypothetical protein